MPFLPRRLDDWLRTNSSIPLTDKVFFTDNLRVMIHAGFSISEALATLSLQAESKKVQAIIASLKTDVEEGRLLSDGMLKFPKAFPMIYVSMVRVGEISGTLEESLLELTSQMKKEYKLVSKVRGAMTYPIVILIAMLGITTGLLVFVIPKLLDVFKEFGDVQLPLPTRILIFVSDFVSAHGLLLAAALVALAVAFVAAIRTKGGKHIFDAAVLRAPILGPISHKINLARFSRTFASLLKTDIPVVQSLDITSHVVANSHYHEALRTAAERIKKGSTIADSLSTYTALFPPLVIQMIYVGERSGQVDALLADIADFYEQQVDQVLDNLSSIIEPVLILILGTMVGGIALSVMLPLYALTQSAAGS